MNIENPLTQREPWQCRIWGAHKWSKWSATYMIQMMYKWTERIGYEHRQKRTCLRCGKEEERDVRF